MKGSRMTGSGTFAAGAGFIPAQATRHQEAELRRRRGLVGEPWVPPPWGYWNIVEAVVAAGKGSA
jgi:hypothetical protein